MKKNPSNSDSLGAQIEATFMDGTQRAVFEVFCGLGHERSLRKLQDTLTANGQSYSDSQLKRWSTKFKWFDLALRTDHAIGVAIEEKMVPVHTERISKALDSINTLKEKFYERVQKGEITVDLPDFINLIKVEALILGDPTERREEVHTTHISHEFKGLNPAQIAAITRIAAAQEYGLPPVEEPINVTPHDEDEEEAV
jgi:hypothetical protein